MTDATDRPACACGALPAAGQTRCRKCIARANWLKRQAGRLRRTRRARTRRPPGDPRGTLRPGVSRP